MNGICVLPRENNREVGPMKKVLSVCLVAMILIGAICFIQPTRLNADETQFQQCVQYCQQLGERSRMCIILYCLPLR